MAPRTVLILHSSAQRYGSDAQLLTIARGLDPDRWRPVCVLPERGELAPALEQAGVEVFVHPLAVLRRGLFSAGGLARLTSAIARDRRVLGRLATDREAALVHSNTSVVLSGRAVAKRAGAAHLVHVREIYAGSAGRAGAALWPAMRRRLQAAGELVCISHAVARQFPGAARVRVIYDGLAQAPPPPDRATARAELGIAEGRFVAALVGRVSDWKGQDVLIRALGRTELVENGTIALLAGDAYPGNEAHERELVALAGRLGVTGRILRLGFRADVGTVLGAADVLVVPSTRPEPLGLVAIEGAAAGLPVIASAHGGVTEVVRHGKTGLLVPPGDPAALARALRHLADNPELACRLGEAGRRDAGERFSAERMLAALQSAYDEAAQRT